MSHAELQKMTELYEDYDTCAQNWSAKMSKKGCTELRKKLMALKKQADLSRKYLLTVQKSMPVRKRGSAKAVPELVVEDDDQLEDEMGEDVHPVVKPRSKAKPKAKPKAKAKK